MPAQLGPKLELWRTAVPHRRADVPALQGGEHMTVGQVRHPALRSAFAEAFSSWFFATKRACKKWKGPKLQDTAVPHLLKASNAKLTAKAAKNMTKMLAAALGWDEVTCQQLKDMLESCSQPDQALHLLLRNSRSHPATLAAEAIAAAAAAARAKQTQKQTQAQRSKQAKCHEGQAAAPAGSTSESEADEADSDEEEEAEEGDWDEEWEQQHSWLALPRDIPCKGVRVARVPDTDPRGPLRGQFGIWAANDLPEGFLLGPYRSYCMYSRAYENVLTSKPSNWPGTHASWRLLLDSYACNDDSETTGTFKTTDASGVHKYSVMYSGFGYGNETAYANDPHLDPVKHLLMPDMPDDYLGPLITGPDGKEVASSVQIVYATVCGWAYAFMTTVIPVSKGQECLYDYGHSYWTFAATGIAQCDRDKELMQKDRQLKELAEQLRAATQVTSGLTTSINGTSSVHPGTTQDTPAAAAAARPAAAAAAAAARLLKGRALPVQSAGGSCAPTGNQVQNSGPGVSDMRQQLVGMQLASGRNCSSDGGASESAGGGASVAQQQQQLHQQQQQQQAGLQAGVQQQQQGGREGSPANRQAESAGEAAVSVAAGAAAGDTNAGRADEEDDACSAVPPSVRGYADLQVTPQQLSLLQQRQQQGRRQQTQQTRDEAGNVHQVKCIDDPDVVQMIKDVEMELSLELLNYPSGIRYKKVRSSWWDKFAAVKDYFYDQWDFITRHSQLFELSEGVFGRNTKILLTPEWRAVLVEQLRSEGRLPLSVLREEAAAAAAAAAAADGGLPAGQQQQQQQQYNSSSNKRKRGQVTVTQVVVDFAEEKRLRKVLKQRERELQEVRSEVDKLRREQEGLHWDLQQARQNMQVLLRLAAGAGVRVPPEILQQQQQQEWAGEDRSGQQGRSGAPAAAAAAAAGAGAPALDPSLFAVETAPLHVGLCGSSGSDTDSGSEDPGGGGGSRQQQPQQQQQQQQQQHGVRDRPPAGRGWGGGRHYDGSRGGGRPGHRPAGRYNGDRGGAYRGGGDRRHYT